VLDDKELKNRYGKVFSEKFNEYYPVGFLQSHGFQRSICERCGRAFWSVEAGNTCGDSTCYGGYTFIGRKRNNLDYSGVWKSFSSYLKKIGYTPIRRYPVAARWRDDIHFVEASIDDFIPYVINGVVKPPANPLTVPQFSLRFKDLENVGVTGAHYTGFVMIGQHSFQDKLNYNPDSYLTHLYSWFEKEVKLDKSEVFFHEDVWAGSGNFGPCIEIFSGGVELANQVYMQFRQTKSGYKDLNMKVLDMGMGQERVAWFSQGKGLSYETTFPYVVSKLKKATGIVVDQDLVGRFLPYAGMLNADEVDLDVSWNTIAKTLDVGVDVLMEEIRVLSSIYAVGDHTRSLLIALTDGALPSNSGGGYNLRVILRRSLDFIKKYNWDISLYDVILWHMKEMKKDYPEIIEMEDEIGKIMEVEEGKYSRTRKRVNKMLGGIKHLDDQKMVEIYDSHGITAEMLKKAGFKVPDNFYELISSRHTSKKHKREKVEDELNLPKTDILYLQDYKNLEFDAKVLFIDKNKVVLDRTGFYAASGGQDKDNGKIGGQEVLDIYKAGDVVVHVVDRPKFKVGDTVHGQVYWLRREQLAQHHTAVHIINGAARQVLGNHIWQAGADKTIEKARIDITHYASLTDDEIEKIEKVANNMIEKGVKVNSRTMPKDEAEKKFGFRVYQGGFVPGGELRIVEIKDFDIEACGGTHLNNTKEAEMIKITSTSKIQDGVVRIEIKAGNAVRDHTLQLIEIANESCKLLGCSIKNLPDRCEILFKEWKNARKGRPASFETGTYKEVSASSFEQIKKLDNALSRAGDILKVQKEHIPKTITRFLGDIRGKSK
jgi:alanyl-tRNA synthetase